MIRDRGEGINRVGGRNRDGFQPGAAGGSESGGGVLNRQAVLRRVAEFLSSQQVCRGVGLGAFHIIRRHDMLEKLFDITIAEVGEYGFDI